MLADGFPSPRPRRVPVLGQVCVQSLGLDRASSAPVVILQESDGERVLPIWIGPGEASGFDNTVAETIVWLNE